MTVKTIDIFYDIFLSKFMAELSKNWIDETTLRVMTYKSGSFTFQLGADIEKLAPMLDRINDAQLRFIKIPTLPVIIDELQEKVLASSIYSTNTIEGGEYSETETAQILQQDPKTLKESKEKRLINLKEALLWVNQHSYTNLEPYRAESISENIAITLHGLVSKDLTEQHNPIGMYRDNQAGQKTVVGDNAHGGTYRPPKCLADIEYLMKTWVEWLNSEGMMKQPAIIRACLAHYYFELIHPFFDGNGRTGRLIEMLVLEQAGYRFASSAVWRFYQQNIDEYFGLFNQCRKLADKKQPFANQNFVAFSLKGMFETINYLHDQTNGLLSLLLFQSGLNNAKANHEINDRQFGLVYVLMGSEPITPSEAYRLPAIKAIYQSKTDRTFYRDIKKLSVQLKLLAEHDGLLRPNY